MFDKLMDNLFFILLPLGMFVYVCVNGPTFGDWRIDWAIRGFVGLFIFGFILSHFFHFKTDGSSSFSQMGRKLSDSMFAVFGFAFMVAFGYIVFFVIKPDGFVPVWFAWLFRAGYLIFAGIMLYTWAVDFAKSQKGDVEIGIEYLEYVLGETVCGSVNLELFKPVLVESAKVSLVGLEQERLRHSVDQYSYTERVRKTLNLPVQRQTLFGEENAFDFEFNVDDLEIGEWVNKEWVDDRHWMIWRIVAKFECEGVDLSTFRDIKIYTESKMDEVALSRESESQ